MSREAAGFLVGVALGIALPPLLLAARNLCRSWKLAQRTTAFFSLLVTHGVALGGGTVVALISGRLGPSMAAGSVFAGMMLVAVVYRNRTVQEPGGMIGAYALSFCPPFVLAAMVGGGLVSG